MIHNLVRSTLAVGVIGSVLVASPAMAASTVVVSPSQKMGWSKYTMAQGDVNYVNDTTVPDPYKDGVLQITTAESVDSVASYSKKVSVKLADVTDASYMAKALQGFQPQTSPMVDLPTANASYSMTLDLNGDGKGDTSLVYEPYNQVANDSSAQVSMRGEWQTWNVRDGYFWSTKTYETANLTFRAGSGGAPFYTLDQVAAAVPDAMVTGISVYAGSWNPGYQVNVDAVTFNGVTYNFQMNSDMRVAKEQCKENGYLGMATNDGKSFKNQGECVSYFAKQQR